jgi:hypothetical protein
MIHDESLQRLWPCTRRMALKCALTCATVGYATLGSASAFAQSSVFVMPERQALLLKDVSSVVGTDAATGVVGALAVNLAAGVDNVQSNQAAVLYGAGGAIVSGQQQTVRSTRTRIGTASVQIDGNAFSNTVGVVAVNQAAGANNLQRNAVAVGGLSVGAEAVTDTVLSVTAARNGGPRVHAGAGQTFEASISGDAFKGAAGIVQVNQTAGAGNATANSFVLRPPAGTFF